MSTVKSANPRRRRPAKRTDRIEVRVAEVFYTFSGRDMKNALAGAGISQADFSRLLGYAGGAQVSRMLNDPDVRVTATTMKRIADALRSANIRVDGITS